LKPDSSPPADTKLFRDAVLKARSARSLGQIILTPQARTSWLVLIAALLGVLVVLFLTYGTYTRRATVTGQLVPSAGVIRVHTPQAGVVLERKVNEGQVVQKGDVLFVLNSDRIGQRAPAKSRPTSASRWMSERRSLEAELARNKGVEAAEVGHLERRAARCAPSSSPSNARWSSSASA
jgi:membrane fusion protein